MPAPIFQQVADLIEQTLPWPWQGIRADINMQSGGEDVLSRPTWLLVDPVSGHHFQLDRDDHAFYAELIQNGDLATTLASYHARYRRLPDPTEVGNFLRQLQTERLALGAPPERDTEPALGHEAGGIRRAMYWRIPLIKPDAFLNATFGAVRWLWHPIMRVLWLTIGMTGLIMMLPQFELYLATTGSLFTLAGASTFTLTLVVLKIGHEFAHAYAAKAQGLYVPRMGIALIAFWPVLYTDASEAWRLKEKRQRLSIDCAGISFEMVVAGVSLFIWSMLPNGLWREVMFFLSGTSLLSSIFININPLMRFDGYYILMDLWGIDNLQPRSMALWRHRQRRWFWDWQGLAPEIHPHAKAMAWYGAFVSIYRVIIGFVIGLVAYNWVHPWLGIVIFGYVLSVFVIRPWLTEIGFLVKMRKEMGKRYRVALTFIVFGVVLALLVMPLRGAHSVPGLLMVADATAIKAAHGGQLMSALPAVGARVEKGQLLARFSNAELQKKLSEAELEAAETQMKIRHTLSAGEEGGYRDYLQAELRQRVAHVDKLKSAMAQLDIRAPFAGEVLQVNESLNQGDYTGQNHHVLTLGNRNRWEVRAYLSDSEIKSVTIAQQAEVSLSGEADMAAVLKQSSRVAVQQLPNEFLYDVYGGDIPSRETDDGLVPKTAFYEYRYAVPSPKSYVRHGTPVSLSVNRERQSIAGGWLKSISKMFAEDGLL